MELKIGELTGIPDIEKELRELGVSEIIPYGERGYKKGWRGHVFKVKVEEKIAAIKVTEKAENEAKLLQLANSVGVGPKFIAKTEHIVAMQFLDGPFYADWVQTAEKEDIKQVVLDVLEQCHALDKINLDHGQLSNADRHIIICEKPYVIDFEKGSDQRTCRNLSAVLNFLMLNPYGAIATKTRAKLNIDATEISGYARKTAIQKEEAFQRLTSAILTA
jgi:putative serine/threonine protein kinase